MGDLVMHSTKCWQATPISNPLRSSSARSDSRSDSSDGKRGCGSERGRGLGLRLSQAELLTKSLPSNLRLDSLRLSKHPSLDIPAGEGESNEISNAG